MNERMVDQSMHSEETDKENITKPTRLDNILVKIQ